MLVNRKILVKTKKDQIPTNTLVPVSESPKIIVYSDGHNYYAFNGICPHAKWPLMLGTVSDSKLTCAAHCWEFNIKDGSCITNPGRDLKYYKVEVNGDEVRIFD